MNAWKNGDLARARKFVERCPEQLRNWEWHYLQRLCHRELVDLQFQGPILSATFTADENKILVADANNQVIVRDLENEMRSEYLTGHQKPVYDPVCSAGGKYYATASFDGTVRVWDGATNQSILTIDSFQPGQYWHKQKDHHLAFSPDGSRLAVGGRRRNLQLWNLKKRELEWELEDLLPARQAALIAFAPSGDQLFCSSEGEFGYMLAVVDVENGRKSNEVMRNQAELEGGRVGCIRCSGTAAAGVLRSRGDLI